jgi:hypothetical protein
MKKVFLLGLLITLVTAARSQDQHQNEPSGETDKIGDLLKQDHHDLDNDQVQFEDEQKDMLNDELDLKNDKEDLLDDHLDFNDEHVDTINDEKDFNDDHADLLNDPAAPLK